MFVTKGLPAVTVEVASAVRVCKSADAADLGVVFSLADVTRDEETVDFTNEAVCFENWCELSSAWRSAPLEDAAISSGS